MSVTRFVGLLRFDISKTSPLAPIDRVLARGEVERSLSLLGLLGTRLLLLTSASQLENGDVPVLDDPLIPDDSDERVELDRTTYVLLRAVTMVGLLLLFASDTVSASDKAGVAPLLNPTVGGDGGAGLRFTCCCCCCCDCAACDCACSLPASCDFATPLLLLAAVLCAPAASWASAIEGRGSWPASRTGCD